MRLLAAVLTFVVIALHVGFAAAEMVYWQHPAVMARFGTTPEFAKASAVLAANQGLYNGLFAAAIAWALFRGRHDALLMLLACIIVAGVYGAYSTGKPTIMLVQALPALLALAATAIAGRSTLK
jgi:putative membrane protein